MRLTAGCNGSEPDTRLDNTFDPCAGLTITTASTRDDEVASIDAAIRLWNLAGGLALTRDEVADFPRLEVTFERAATASRGLYDDERGVVIINSAIDDADQRAITVAHELGHAFGLWHVAPDERSSLMNPDNRSVGPTEQDVAKLRSLWSSCAELATK